MPYFITITFFIILMYFIVDGVLSLFSKKEVEIQEPFPDKGFDHSRKLKNQIFECLINENFTVNHLNHYTFNIDNQKHVYGIVSLVEIYGINIFKDAKRIREERKHKNKNNVIPIQFNK